MDFLDDIDTSAAFNEDNQTDLDWLNDVDTNAAFVDENLRDNLNDTIDMSVVERRLSLVQQKPTKRRYVHRQPRERAKHANNKRAKMCIIKEDLHLSYCCKNRCMEHFTTRTVEQIRLPFIEKTETQRLQWLFDVLNASLIDKGPTSPPKVQYRLLGHVVCQQAYIRLLGVSVTKLTPILRQIKTSKSVIVSPHGNSLRTYNTPKSDIVHIFLNGLMAIFFDEQPDSDQWHCPIVINKKLLFDQLKEEMEEHPSSSVFYSVLKQHRWIKFPKQTRLGKCDECIELRRELRKATAVSRNSIANILKKIKSHNTLQKLERLTYAQRKLLDKSLYWQIIWDGYSGILIPHIAWPDFPKSWLRLARLRLQISGLINHNIGQRKLYVSIAQQFAHDSNYSINLLSIHLGEQIQAGNQVPPALIFQSDNCWRENKNIFLFGFFAVLLLKKATNVIYFICLPQGHTHTDIDQENVPVAKGLKAHNLHTGSEEDVTNYIHQCYNNPPEIKMVRTIFNFRDWLLPYLPKLSGHTKPHVFRFYLNSNGAVEMQWRDYTSTDETWKASDNGDPIIILHSIPPGLPSEIPPLPIDDKVITATRKTYDKLDIEQQQFYESLFQPDQQPTDKSALYILNHEFEQSGVKNELAFLPKQKQQPWISSTTIGVIHKAALFVNNNNNNNNNEMLVDAIIEENDSAEDYDAPILMEPVTNWTARGFRNLNTAEYGKSKRKRKMNSRFND